MNQTEPTLEERVKALEEAVHKLGASSGRGVVEPNAVKTPAGYVKAEEILAILPKRVPYIWGAEANELVRKVRAKCLQPTQDSPHHPP